MKTIEQIRQTPLIERRVMEEYALAKHEQRQPYCVYCGKQLEVVQTQHSYLCWRWDETSKSYVQRDEEGDADKPTCVQCGEDDWDFIDEDLVNF